MANPRKFSEKIALHTHRQAEETAAFEKIMKEVSDVKPNEEPSPNHQHQNRMINNNNNNNNNNSAALIQRQSRTKSPSGGPIRSNIINNRERKLSPYSSSSSGPYLSPPSDNSGWRRTHSDSALHQSTIQGISLMERNDNNNQRCSWGVQQNNLNNHHHHHHHHPTTTDTRNFEGRPRSSCDLIPRVPGIHIYPSAHDPSMVQIPIGNNTGSLPDLTNMDFTSPIHVPLDQDQDSTTSPYSSSPLNTSPSTLSPTNIMPSGQSLRNHHHHHHHHQQQQQNRFNFNQSAVSQSPLPSDKSSVGLDGTDFAQLGAINVGIYQHSSGGGSPSSSSSPVQLPQMDNNYRNNSRPSPQASPTLVTGHHSAPCSPAEPDYHNIHNQTIQFQQHFEQLTVSDAPIEQLGGFNSSDLQQNSSTLVTEIGNNDAGYFSTSPSNNQHQLVFPSASSPSVQNTSPNTPTSLPEIILTDFSASPQDLNNRQQLENDYLDEQLKESLGSIDFSELQMLNNIGGISEIVEDFRS